MKPLIDLTGAFRMPADSFAGIFALDDGRFAVAWGRAYGALADGGRWDASDNTADHGAEVFATLTAAQEYAGEVAACHEA